MIPAIIGAAVGLGSTVLGSIFGNKRRKKAEQLQNENINKRRRELQEWRDKELNSNYVDRVDSQALIRRITEANKEAQSSLNTDAIKSGATDEAKVAMASRLNRNLADATSQIAAQGAVHKDRVQNQYMYQKTALDDQQDGIRMANLMDTSGIDTMISGIGSAAGNLLSASNIGSGAKKTTSFTDTSPWAQAVLGKGDFGLDTSIANPLGGIPKTASIPGLGRKFPKFG